MNKHRQKSGQKFIELNFVNADQLMDFKLNFNAESPAVEIGVENICKNYSVYGYCNTETCVKSHDIEIILKSDLMKRDKQNVQKLKALQENNTIESNNIEEINTKNKSHTAGLDAFMTGYVMLNYINKFTKFETKSTQEYAINCCRLDQFVNLENFNFNVYLSGKDYPLIVRKSNFATTSLNHQEKKQRTSLSIST